MTALPEIDNSTARAIFLDRHGLAATPTGSGRGEHLQDMINALGFVQVDSINTVARAHHMILHAAVRLTAHEAFDFSMIVTGAYLNIGPMMQALLPCSFFRIGD